jgi:hypothetical protein
MNIERQEIEFDSTQRARNDGRADGETEAAIEPDKAASLTELMERGRKEFSLLLSRANLRSLLRYIEDGGIKLDAQEGVNSSWRTFLRDREFLAQSYTWSNPKLFLLSRKSAASLALDELLRRLQSGGTLL